VRVLGEHDKAVVKAAFDWHRKVSFYGKSILEEAIENHPDYKGEK